MTTITDDDVDDDNDDGEDDGGNDNTTAVYVAAIGDVTLW